MMTLVGDGGENSKLCFPLQSLSINLVNPLFSPDSIKDQNSLKGAWISPQCHCG